MSKHQYRMWQYGDRRPAHFRKLERAMRTARDDHPACAHAQVDAIFRYARVAGVFGSAPALSGRTIVEYERTLHRVIDLCGTLWMPVKNLQELDRGHVKELVAYWRCVGLKSTTIRKYRAILRRFFCMLGKQHVIPPRRASNRRPPDTDLAAKRRGLVDELADGRPQ